MNLLALDTSTEACSCALYVSGESFSRSEIAPRQHAELILPMVDNLLAEAELSPNQLDGIAFGKGPGSFTGLRIACGVVQGMAFGLDIPVIPISSLATLAQLAYIEHQWLHVAAAIDARMQEVYWGCYALDDNQLMQLRGEEQVCPPQSASLPFSANWMGMGSGWHTYHELLTSTLGDMEMQKDSYPLAFAMLPLAVDAFQKGQMVTPENALPTYLRNNVVHV